MMMRFRWQSDQRIGKASPVSAGLMFGPNEIMSMLSKLEISDTTFIEKKEAAKILYKLWKDECLHMEVSIEFY
ncbi:hypothetical protein CK203_001321 [Vitis vinifera]|uniref:Uncharacterized protein n=1 Tax=Vitis vinifera TaxID=29760 RepID=A0A438KKR9_VITVI|nr:hypothetical protein CK203_001321 [Vitis vinifera]